MATEMEKQNKKAGGTLPVSAGPSSYYGETELLKQRQRQMPMGQAPTEAIRRTAARVGLPQEQLQPLSRPTERPGEPITYGANFGPGANMVQAGIPIADTRNRAIQELHSIALMYPDSGLGDLIDKYGA